jgi:hypothetical protein
MLRHGERRFSEASGGWSSRSGVRVSSVDDARLSKPSRASSRSAAAKSGARHAARTLPSSWASANTRRRSRWMTSSVDKRRLLSDRLAGRNGGCAACLRGCGNSRRCVGRTWSQFRLDARTSGSCIKRPRSTCWTSSSKPSSPPQTRTRMPTSCVGPVTQRHRSRQSRPG